MALQDITTYLNRLVAMETAAVSGSEGYAYNYVQTQAMLFWTNLYRGVSLESLSHLEYAMIHTVTATLHRAPLTAGYGGEHEILCQQDIVTVMTYFRARRSLTLNPTDTPLSNVIPDSLTISSNGVQRIENEERTLFGSIYQITFAIANEGGY